MVGQRSDIQKVTLALQVYIRIKKKLNDLQVVSAGAKNTYDIKNDADFVELLLRLEDKRAVVKPLSQQSTKIVT